MGNLWVGLRGSVNPQQLLSKCVSICALLWGRVYHSQWLHSSIYSSNIYLLTLSQPWLPGSATLMRKGKTQKTAKGLSLGGGGGRFSHTNNFLKLMTLKFTFQVSGKLKRIQGPARQNPQGSL